MDEHEDQTDELDLDPQAQLQLDLQAQRLDIPDRILEKAWTPDVGKEYDIPCKAFYEVRKTRKVQAVVRQGKPAANIGTISKKGIQNAVQANVVSARTGQKLEQLHKKSPSKTSSRTQEEHERGKICVIYKITMEEINDFLPMFVITHGIAREFVRIGSDPLSKKITWDSIGFPVARFLQILTARNLAITGQPSMYTAFFGRPETTMHSHNWWIKDDQAHKDLTNLLRKWQAWGIDQHVQVQLVSFTSVYNGKAVYVALDAVKDEQNLPIRANQLLPEMWQSMDAFVREILSAGDNPFSIRLRTRNYNACKDTRSPGATPLRACGGIKSQRESPARSGTTKVAFPFCTIWPTNSSSPDLIRRSISATVRPGLSCLPLTGVAGRMQIATLSPGSTFSISSGGMNTSRPSSVTANP